MGNIMYYINFHIPLSFEYLFTSRHSHKCYSWRTAIPDTPRQINKKIEFQATLLSKTLKSQVRNVDKKEWIDWDMEVRRTKVVFHDLCDLPLKLYIISRIPSLMSKLIFMAVKCRNFMKTFGRIGGEHSVRGQYMTIFEYQSSKCRWERWK